jgi:organic radical activating enzyme
VKETGISNIVFTGGEPFLQLNESLFIHIQKTCASNNFLSIAVETNGSIPVSTFLRTWIDCLTVSPKKRTFVVESGTDFKLLYGIFSDRIIRDLRDRLNFKRFYIQPIFGENEEEAIKFVMEEKGRWILSTQIQKWLKIQ